MCGVVCAVLRYFISSSPLSLSSCFLSLFATTRTPIPYRHFSTTFVIRQTRRLTTPLPHVPHLTVPYEQLSSRPPIPARRPAPACTASLSPPSKSTRLPDSKRCTSPRTTSSGTLAPVLPRPPTSPPLPLPQQVRLLAAFSAALQCLHPPPSPVDDLQHAGLIADTSDTAKY